MSRSVPDKDQERQPLVWIMANGSRGDFQPFLALGEGLKAAGWRVVIVSSANFATFTKAAGLEAFSPFVDSEAFLQEDPKSAEFFASGDLAQLFKLARAADLELFPGMISAVGERLCQHERPDLLVFSYLVQQVAQFLWVKHQVPGIRVDLQLSNFRPNVEGRPPVGMPNLPLGLNWIWGAIIAYSNYCHSKKLDKMIMDIEGVEPYRGYSARDYYRKVSDSTSASAPFGIPVLEAATSVLHELCPKTPYAECTTPVGPFVLTERDQDAADAAGVFGGHDVKVEIDDFLAAGEPPVYIGWGSMVLPGEMLVQLAVGALKKAGARGIIASGWARLSSEMLVSAVSADGDPGGLVEYAAANVLFVRRAPHEYLFPRCSAAVHHGGMGTLTANLRAGTPIVVTPVILDQFESAELVEVLGVGRGCKRLPALTVEELGEAIASVAINKGVKAKALEVMRLVRDEDGVGRAVEYINSYMEEEMRSGNVHRKWVEEQRLIKQACDRSARLQTIAAVAATASIAGLLVAYCSPNSGLSNWLRR